MKKKMLEKFLNSNDNSKICYVNHKTIYDCDFIVALSINAKSSTNTFSSSLCEIIMMTNYL